jgi:RNA polymerase sigma-54 factor
MLQIQDQSLRPLTTAHLAQTMSMLVLSNQELRDRVIAELASNPALEIQDERVCPGCKRVLRGTIRCPVCTQKSKHDEPLVFLSPRDSMRQYPSRSFEEAPTDQEPAAPEDLTTYVLRQLAAELQHEDRPLAIYILSSLDDDGFLNDPAPFIAQATRKSIFDVQRVISLISSVDPIGLATNGPKDALLVQLDQVENDVPQRELAILLIKDFFTQLAQKEYESISATLDVTQEEIRTTIGYIQENLNPYPARSNWGSGRNPKPGDPNVYHSPDILITTKDDDKNHLVVEIFSAIAGNLRVNPMFRKALGKSDDEKSDEWSRHLDRANLFVKCLQQRNNTMRKLMELLVSQQRDFILEGARHLEPMTRAHVAEEIGVHESTISRAVAHKSVALPDGRIIPLAKFFDRSLSIRDRIKEIVRNEAKPLTDDQIASVLGDEGVKIARRTVAKYRAIEGILPARLRGQTKAAQLAGV